MPICVLISSVESRDKSIVAPRRRGWDEGIQTVLWQTRSHPRSSWSEDRAGQVLGSVHCSDMSSPYGSLNQEERWLKRKAVTSG